MTNQARITVVAALAASVLALGLLAGCGDTSSDGSGTPAGAGTATGKPSGTGPATEPSSGEKPRPGHDRGRNPASAGDKRGGAPDDVIQDRPGGPKPPGAPQPQR